MPSACSTHGWWSPSSGREWTDTGRLPDSSGPTTTCTRVPPCSGTISGACMTSSRTVPQPARSPANSASSTRAAPGTSTTSPTAWSASQPWVSRPIRPVNTTPPDDGCSTTAPSRGCSHAADRPGSRHHRRRLRLQPVPLTREGIRRQVDAGPTRRPDQLRPVDRSARGVQRRPTRRPRTALRPGRRGSTATAASLAPDCWTIAVSAAVRPHFDERAPSSAADRAATASANRTGSADVPHPVARVAPARSPASAPVTFDTTRNRAAARTTTRQPPPGTRPASGPSAASGTRGCTVSR